MPGLLRIRVAMQQILRLPAFGCRVPAAQLHVNIVPGWSQQRWADWRAVSDFPSTVTRGNDFGCASGSLCAQSSRRAGGCPRAPAVPRLTARQQATCTVVKREGQCASGARHWQAPGPAPQAGARVSQRRGCKLGAYAWPQEEGGVNWLAGHCTHRAQAARTNMPGGARRTC